MQLFQMNKSPVQHQVLIDILHEFKNPNDKIRRLKKEGK